MLLTASSDGVVKFWKRTGSNEGVEFVKSFTAHVGAIAATCSSTGARAGSTAATVGFDGVISLYDVHTFDVTGIIKTDNKSTSDTAFGNSACFVSSTQQALAVSHATTSSISIYDLETMSPIPAATLSLHSSPVTTIMYHSGTNTAVSTSTDGMIEYWDANTNDASSVGGAPRDVGFTSKFATDLFNLAKKQTYCVASAMCATKFAVYGADRKIRLFDFSTGKNVVTYDDSLAAHDKEFNAKRLKVDDISYGKLCSVEREVNASRVMNATAEEKEGEEVRQRLAISFDETGRLLIFPTLNGIKVIDVENHRVVRIIGGDDANQLRFLGVTVCSTDSKVDEQMLLARGGSSGAAIDHSEAAKALKADPTLVAYCFNKKRFYMFNKFDPVTDAGDDDNGRAVLDRDALNEPPEAEDMVSGIGGLAARKKKANALGDTAILRTSMGDIHMKLFGADTPLTVENFCTHAKNGYYNNVIFHRVIKGFMLQTGDPLGDGTGGESIWGGEFEDEFVRGLRHDRPFTVSMANAGAGTNGSQFFITTVPTPWLDNKHTVFGRVVKGMDVCTSIEDAPTDHLDKPTREIKIISVDIE
jgi:peptidylprolyl isomerase domain and WD repeat-containing protein 1